MVLTPDRHGLFADIAGALSREGANVVGAQVTTTSDGRAFDVFYVQEQGGKPFGWSDSYIQDRLRDSVQSAAEHGLSGDDARSMLKPLRRREAEAAAKMTEGKRAAAAPKGRTYCQRDCG